MSTTTQILFNSPALHSLKRDQLVKLCKIHDIKASGKNTELIDKLKKHAKTLPKDAPLSVAARSENLAAYLDDDGDETMHDATEREQSQLANAHWGFQMPRPSEHWDVVMDDIEEVDEKSSQGTLNSIRAPASNNGGSDEFGTIMSKSSSVTSSLKSLASSFGIQQKNVSKAKASTSFPSSTSSKSALHILSPPAKNDPPAQTFTSDSSLPDTSAPQKDKYFTFDLMPGNPISSAGDYRPFPGHSLLPGVPAPSNARLSLGIDAPATPTRDQPTTTIRLISSPVSNGDVYGRTPQLQPFKTSFDLDIGSPQPSGGFRGVSLWPPSEGQQKSGLYPPLPLEDPVSSPSDAAGNSSSAQFASNVMNIDVSVPGSLAPPKPVAPSLLSPPKSTTITQLAVPNPFVFGSPLPQHNVSNSQFKSAATSVLEEMNKRLKQDGIDGVGMDLITKLQPGAHAAGVGISKPHEKKEASKKKVFKEKFDKLHEEEFSKMEGIDSLMKRRGLLANKDAAAAGRLVVKKRELRVGGSAGHGVGRDRFGRRIGGEGGRLSAARVVSDSRQRRRSRVIPGAFGDDDEEREEGQEGDAKPAESAKADDKKNEDVTKAADEKKTEAEEEERKQKEKEAIKRKLEMNKARKSSITGTKGRVSVGRGGVIVKPQPAPQPKPSKFGFFSSAKSLVAKVWGGGKTATPAATAKTNGIPKSTTTKGFKSAPVPTPAPALVPKKEPSTAINPLTGKVSSLRGGKDKASVTMSSTTSSLRSRPPLPSFTPAPCADATTTPAPSTTTKSSNAEPMVPVAETSAKSAAGVSSLGTRSSVTSTARSLSSATVSSIGSKKLLTGSGSRSSVPASATATGSSNFSRFSCSRKSSSRLLAPTASSLAKANANKPSVSGSKSSLKNVAEGSGAPIHQSQSTEGETFSMITNSPRIPGEPWSPRPERIFSKPLSMPSGIATAVKKRPTTMTTENSIAEKEGVKEADTVTGAATPKQRSLNGRKPRISRSRVIARLASQRAASASRVAPPGSTPGAKAGRTRSSLGVKAQRSSYGGKSITAKGVEDNVLMSAKKRVRQSEYARRKSRPASMDLRNGANAMDIDAE